MTASQKRQIQILTEIRDAWIGELARAKKPTAIKFAEEQIAAYNAKILAVEKV